MSRKISKKFELKKLPLFAWFKFIVIFNLLLYIFALYLFSVKTTSFFIDEQGFLRKSYFYDLFFIKKNFTDIRWTTDEFNQPRLGPYLYGFVLHLNGIRDINEWQQQSRFNEIVIGNKVWFDALWGERLEDFPPSLSLFADIIYKARYLSIGFTLTTFALILYLGILVRKFLFSLLGVFFLANNGLMYYYGRVAMTDSFQLFFFLANLVLIIYLTKKYFLKKRQRIFFLSLLLGLIAALAASVKVIGIMALLFNWIIFVCLFLLDKKNWRTLLANFLILNCVFFLVFTILNPQVYPNPSKIIWQMFTVRWHVSVDNQILGIGPPVENRGEALKRIFQNLLLPGSKYGSFYFLPNLDLILLLGGLITLVLKIWTNWQKQKILSFEAILFLWFLTVFGCLTLYLKNDLNRYYLPLASAITLIQAYFLAQVLIYTKIYVSRARFSAG